VILSRSLILKDRDRSHDVGKERGKEDNEAKFRKSTSHNELKPPKKVNEL